MVNLAIVWRSNLVLGASSLDFRSSELLCFVDMNINGTIDLVYMDAARTVTDSLGPFGVLFSSIDYREQSTISC